MQLSRSQFQGHPKLNGVLFVSTLSGVALGIYGEDILNWLASAMNNPDLISPIQLTRAAEVAFRKLVTMLNSLPQDSPVLKFILEHLDSNFEVLGSIVEGKIVPHSRYELPYVYAVPKIVITECSNAGVYLLNHIDTDQQYIGSASSLPIT